MLIRGNINVHQHRSVRLPFKSEVVIAVLLIFIAKFIFRKFTHCFDHGI